MYTYVNIDMYLYICKELYIQTGAHVYVCILHVFDKGESVLEPLSQYIFHGADGPYAHRHIHANCTRCLDR